MALQLWLPLNGDTKNYGLKNIDVLDYGTSEYNKGKIGKCRSFVGNGYLKLVNSFGIEPYKDFSCCYWIKEISNNTLSGFRVVYQCGDLIIGHYNDKINIYNAKDLDFVYKCDTTDWVHCCLTYQSSSNIMTIYINGIKRSTRQPKSLNNLSSTTALIGKRNNESYLLEGYLNDFRLYDECLSPKQIKYISQAMICHYPMGNIDGKIGGRNLLRNTSDTWENIRIDQWNGQTYNRFHCNNVGLKAGDTFTYSVDIKNTNKAGLYARVDFYSEATGSKGKTTNISKIRINKSEDGRSSLTVNIPEGKEYIWLAISNSDTMNDVTTTIEQFRCLKLEKGEKITPYTPAPEDNSQFYDNIIPDISGYRNNATVKDSTCPTWSDDSPRYLGSYKFDATKEMFLNPIVFSGFSDSYTFSWWGKESQQGYTMYWGFMDGNRLNLFNNYGHLFWNTGDGSSNPFNDPVTTNNVSSYIDGKWHHYCVTGDGTSNKLYIDGKIYGIAETYRKITGTKIHINGFDDEDNYKINGNISDFRIYATALSESDVLNLYQSSASLDSQGNLMLAGEVIE